MSADLVPFLKRAADRTGFSREFFMEKNIPTVSSNIVVFPFFGDIRSTFVLSSFLLRRYKELRSTKYMILCSWPGMQALFPYVDEYWSVKDVSSTNSLAFSANNFYNASDVYTTYKRNLIEHFENVITYDELKVYYDNGFTPKFWETFKEVKRYLPDVPSSSRLSGDFKNELTRKSGTKVMVFPAQHLRSWQRGQTDYLRVEKDFWVKLIERLLAEGLIPVVYQNYSTYDMSPEFTDRCIYIVPKDVSQVLAAMRAVGCVIDIHSGISRLAIAARCPFVAADERIRFDSHKDYEIDDLCCGSIPRQYVFHFSTMLMTGTPTDWNTSLIDNIIVRLNKFLPTLDREQWMSTTESYEAVSYDMVRERKAKKLGVRFLKKY
jgi:hypothetical protein